MVSPMCLLGKCFKVSNYSSPRMQSLLEAEPILNVTSPDSGLGPLIDYKQNNSFGLHTCLHNTSPFQTLVQKVTVYDYHSYKKSPYSTAHLVCCHGNESTFLITWVFLPFRDLSHSLVCLHLFFGLFCWVGSCSGRMTSLLKSLCKILDIVENGFQKIIVILLWAFFFFLVCVPYKFGLTSWGLEIWSCYYSV